MAPSKSKNPVFRTEVPFSETKWPEIPAPTQAIILDLLCNLLEPIGQHRQNYIQPSNGKRKSHKRKREADVSPTDITPPPAPEIGDHILVGLNAVTRHLTALAAHTAPPSMPASLKPRPEVYEDTSMLDGESTEKDNIQTAEHSNNKPPPLKPLSVVILPHPKPSSSLSHAHLPTLVYLSATKTDPPTRLVTLSTSSESKLASTLHIPRVGAIGILEGAPGAAGLVEYIRNHVEPVECKWIEESLKPEWRGVKTGV